MPCVLRLDHLVHKPPLGGHVRISKFVFKLRDLILPIGFVIFDDLASKQHADRTLGTPIAMDEHQRFAIREGGRTVGAGRVTKILA